ncbi:hypothetical protein PFLUV_G00206980 [Perca fluviatilis]|uniref:Uncharacterized protein n=1 Tax=Perca fluviatilis TaxID=8168 RepID=A0A6A5EAX9_PERFL|nr:hypothetical protein PFLUV_G00206980 [Perca fluviatilis]
MTMCPPARSRHEERAQRCGDRSRSDAPSPPARSTHDDRSRHSDLSSPQQACVPEKGPEPTGRHPPSPEGNAACLFSCPCRED